MARDAEGEFKCSRAKARLMNYSAIYKKFTFSEVSINILIFLQIIIQKIDVPPMKARLGFNTNGAALAWRCYGTFESTNQEAACIAPNGSMTNLDCSDPRYSNGKHCTRTVYLFKSSFFYME